MQLFPQNASQRSTMTVNTFLKIHILLSSYALNNWLFMPVPHPVDEAEWVYNRWHHKNGFLVENTSGILKQRFR